MKTSGSKFTKWSLDLPGVTKKIEASLESHHRQAIRAWLREVLQHIPTYTGTARGVFKSLAGDIKKVKVSKTGPLGGPTNPKRAAKKEYIVGNGRRIKTGFGAVSGMHSITKDNFGTKLVFTFTHNVDLFYLVWNDTAPAGIKLTHPTPWDSHGKAAGVYKTYIETQAPKSLAVVKDYIKAKIVKVI